MVARCMGALGGQDVILLLLRLMVCGVACLGCRARGCGCGCARHIGVDISLHTEPCLRCRTARAPAKVKWRHANIFGRESLESYEERRASVAACMHTAHGRWQRIPACRVEHAACTRGQCVWNWGVPSWQRNERKEGVGRWRRTLFGGCPLNTKRFGAIRVVLTACCLDTSPGGDVESAGNCVYGWCVCWRRCRLNAYG